MPYLYLTPEDETAMLAAIGAGSIDDLFAMVPPEMRMERPHVACQPGNGIAKHPEPSIVLGISVGCPTVIQQETAPQGGH